MRWALAAAVAAAAAAASAQTMADRVRVFEADVRAVERKFDVPLAEASTRRLRMLYEDHAAAVREVDFEPLPTDGKVEAVLLAAECRYRAALLDREAKLRGQSGDLLKPVLPLVETLQTRVRGELPAAREVAASFAEVTETLEAAAKSLKAKDAADPADRPQTEKVAAYWAAGRLDDVRRNLAVFHRFREGYDPEYSWWCRKPREQLDAALYAYTQAVRGEVVGVPEDDTETIVGVPIGEEGLRVDLAHEFVAYSPEELIAIGRRELAWCDREMKKAAAEMGLGEDWKAALDRTKNDFVPPGDQPQLIVDLALEATEYVKRHDLVTVPPLAEDVWNMTMLSPERQRVSPFFLGGPTIQISYPTDTMTHAEKLMTMRGNNPHFARATVHHELIPGHHLQIYMQSRHRPHRQLFFTPFWMEGWALYFEMLFWDMEFARTPEEKMGMLFWRKHRAARILFSLNYHTGRWTPEECIEFLIDNVGFERKNATAEVRRSVMGGYSPLYQAAYLLGGLQIRDLYKEVVDAGKMTPREFHDFIIQQNSIPIALIRAQLLDEPLTLDFESDWEF